jgi:hypothetical protein
MREIAPVARGLGQGDPDGGRHEERVAPTPADLTVSLAAARRCGLEFQGHCRRIGQDEVEARSERSQFTGIVGQLGRPYPHRTRCIGIGVPRSLVEAPVLGVAVGQKCIDVARLARDVGELCQTDVKRRLDPVARRLGLVAAGVRHIVETVQVAELPVGNFGAGG